jgi:hypothetical protein
VTWRAELRAWVRDPLHDHDKARSSAGRWLRRLARK